MAGKSPSATGGRLAEGVVGGDALGALGGPVDLTQFHLGFLGQFLERGAAGQQVVDVARGPRSAGARGRWPVRRAVRARLFEGRDPCGQDAVDPEERRAQIGGQRADHVALCGGEHRLAGRAQLGEGDVAQIDIAQFQAALLDQRLKGGAADLELRHGLARGGLVGKDQPLDQPPLGQVVLVAAFLVEGAQGGLVHLDLVEDHRGRQQHVGEALGLGQGEGVRIGVVIGLQIGLGRLGQRARRGSRRPAAPR